MTKSLLKQDEKICQFFPSVIKFFYIGTMYDDTDYLVKRVLVLSDCVSRDGGTNEHQLFCCRRVDSGQDPPR